MPKPKDDSLEKFTVAGLTVRLYWDDNVSSPREDRDNLGKMVCWHPRYSLGDKHEWKTPDDFRESADHKAAVICLPLYLYDHSGISMSTSREGCYADPWDAGQVGWIYLTRAMLRKEYGRKWKSSVETARGVLVGEVEEYDQYLTGDVYGYTISTTGRTVLDSLWGLYGLDYARQEARDAAEREAHYQQEQDRKIRECCAL